MDISHTLCEELVVESPSRRHWHFTQVLAICSRAPPLYLIRRVRLHPHPLLDYLSRLPLYNISSSHFRRLATSPKHQVLQRSSATVVDTGDKCALLVVMFVSGAAPCGYRRASVGESLYSWLEI
jgi:hypothetical protein